MCVYLSLFDFPIRRVIFVYIDCRALCVLCLYITHYIQLTQYIIGGKVSKSNKYTEGAGRGTYGIRILTREINVKCAVYIYYCINLGATLRVSFDGPLTPIVYMAI